MPKRDFLRLIDLAKSGDGALALVRRAVELKAQKGLSHCPIIGKSVGLIFEKSSTRTRVSFEVGIYQLGGQAVVLNSTELQLGRGESIPDTARTLSRFLNAIVIRTSAHSRIEEFARHATVPVINALTDDHHPCQALGDMLTIYEKKGRLDGLKVAYIGDGNNVANSLIEASALGGFHISLACPEGYEPHKGIMADAARMSNGSISIVRDPSEAASGADVLYTDVWVSMGKEGESQKRIETFKGFQINSSLISRAKPDAIVMHCLPAYRGKEITDDAMDSPGSVVFDQAENRLHAQKALLESLLR